MTNKAISRAHKLYKQHNSRDPFELAKRLGIRIIYAKGLRKLKGMFRLVGNVPFVFLNDRLSEHMQRIVCAHELGHALLHRSICKNAGQLVEFELFDITTTVELEANEFASELLIDEDELRECIENGYSLVSAAKAMGTNVNLILLKLNAMNEINVKKLALPDMPRCGFMGRISDGDERIY